MAARFEKLVIFGCAEGLILNTTFKKMGGKDFFPKIKYLLLKQMVQGHS